MLEAHPIRHEQDRAIIRVLGPLDRSTVIALCDEIDLAVSYYQYRRVDLHVDSPGGQLAALEFFLSRLDGWQSVEGLVIGTLALTVAASAAAYLVSLGTLGYRRAHPGAQLLYHRTRMTSPEETLVTARRLESYADAMHRADERLIRKIAVNGWPDENRTTIRDPSVADGPRNGGGGEEREVDGPDELARIYTGLMDRDVPITPDAAEGLRLIDRIEDPVPHWIRGGTA